MILNKSQAEAVYNAMCALNNVDGWLKAAVELCTVEQIGGRWVVIINHATGRREEYDGQHLFAVAYGVGY